MFRHFAEGENMKFQFLIENKTDNPGIVAEHGLSVYIESHGKKILFDAGATNLFIVNAAEMKVDLSDVDLAVVSHGHYDHTGGFPDFIKLNEKAKIYIHKNAFRESYGMEDGKMDEEPCSIKWAERDRLAIEPRLSYTDGVTMITEDIAITGTVPVDEDFAPTENFFYRQESDESGELITDDMSHEQCLVIREEKGLYVFSGCSHRGVVNAVNAAKAIFPGERIAVLVAGMHLYSASEEDREQVVSQMVAENMDCIMPVHCTGIKAICDLKAALGDKCIAATAGDKYEF